MKKTLIVSYKKDAPAGNMFKAGNAQSPSLFKSTSENLYEDHLMDQQDRFKGAPDPIGKTKELVTMGENLEGLTEWDLAHLYYDEDKEKGINQVGFVEPDIIDKQTFFPDEKALDLFKSGGKTDCEFEYYYDFWGKPNIATNWHLDKDHSQLGNAWKAVKDLPEDTYVAILDTGFDPDHISRPAFIEVQRNFVEGEPPDSAKDPMITGWLRQAGHGNATAAILAGTKATINFLHNGSPSQFEFEGAYPAARLVYLRISPTVILLRTSALVRALDWIIHSDLPIEVVSMSMGGVARKEWAEKVNQLYDKGIFYTSAAGNSIDNFPTHRTVYPARFNRVVSVCGVQFNNVEYFNLDLTEQMGNYGPDSIMEHAMAAYTPNIAWAKAFCKPDGNGKNIGFSLQGGGTSAATPQVAAAAAMYIKKYRMTLNEFAGWEKVEAVRRALFRSALDLSDDPARSFKFFGQGILRASDALDIQPDRSKLQKMPEDSVRFPLLQILFNSGLHDDPAKQEMFELELLQLAQKDKEVNSIMGESSGFLDLDEKRKSMFVDSVIGSPETSVALKKYMKKMFGK
jgi:hypothetical protein